MSKKPIKTPSPEIETAVMRQIIAGRVQMKPRWYFVLGSTAMIIALSAFMLVAVFSLNLLFFSLRTHGPLGQFRLWELTNSFPWWAILVAVVAGFAGLQLLKKYDFSYRKNYYLILLALLASLLISAWAIDYLGINENFIRRGGLMRRLYRDVPEVNLLVPRGPGLGRFR